MIRRLAVLAAVIAIMGVYAPPVGAAPLTYQPPTRITFPDEGSVPAVTAQSWIVYDDSSGTVLASRNADERRAMASVTKIMTGLLTLEHASMDELVTVSENAAATGEQEIELVAGEQLEMGALFKSLMVHSANDSATAIAEHISGSVEGFVELMNSKAEELGLDNTSFANPHGLDAPDHYSTARDLLELGLAAMDIPEFASSVRSKIVVIPPDPSGTFRSGTTTDLMLASYEGAIGVKTGFTSQAQLTYVGAAEREGRRIYVVVLGSEGRRAHFADATLLLDWAFDEFEYLGKVSVGRPYVPSLRWTEPDPILAQGRVETFVHLSNVGLTLDDPRPPAAAPEEEPVPVVETLREPAPPPDSIGEGLLYWLSGLFG